jgi:hypothetical protein
MDYARAAQASTRMLKNFGKPAVLRFVAQGAYDISTGSASAPDTTDETRSVVLLDFSRYNSGRMLKDGTLVTTGDRWCLMSVGSGREPENSSLVIDGDTVYSIWDVKAVNPAGTPVLFDLVLRREW